MFGSAHILLNFAKLGDKMDSGVSGSYIIDPITGGKLMKVQTDLSKMGDLLLWVGTEDVAGERPVAKNTKQKQKPWWRFWK